MTIRTPAPSPRSRPPASPRPGARRRTGPAQRPTARQWSVDFRRAVRRHRRTLAMLAAAAAVLTGLTALARPAPATVTVVTAARPLAAGATIGAGDLRRTDLPPEAVPEG